MCRTGDSSTLGKQRYRREPTLSRTVKLVLLALSSLLYLAVANAQWQPPSVYQVLMYSGVSSPTVAIFDSMFNRQSGTVTLTRASRNIFSGGRDLQSSAPLNHGTQAA